MLNKLEKAFYWLKSKKIRIIDTVVIVCLLMSYILFKSTDINLNLDFNYNVEIHSGYATFINRHEDAYVIDSGKNRLLKIQDKEVIWSIGEEDETKFDQIENVTADEDAKNVYIHGLKWDESGYLVSKERIMQYDSDGKYLKTLYTADYKDCKPRKSKIFGLRLNDEQIEFIQADEQGFEHVQLIDADDDDEDQEDDDDDDEGDDEDGQKDSQKAVVKSRYEFENAIDLIRDYSISPQSEVMYLTDKRKNSCC